MAIRTYMLIITLNVNGLDAPTKRHRLERNNAICSNMDGPRDYHTKWSKSDRERQISYDITYMWNLIFKKWDKWTYLQNRNRLTDIENKLTVTKGEKEGGWGGGRDKSGTWD